MLVNDKVRIPARQPSFAVIADNVMFVETQHFLIADRHCFFHRQPLGIAFLGMGVFRNLTGSLFHGDGIKLTIAKYYTPSGRSIDGVGVEPDVEVEQPKEATVDEQLQKAIEVMRDKLKE